MKFENGLLWTNCLSAYYRDRIYVRDLNILQFLLILYEQEGIAQVYFSTYIFSNF